MKVVTYYLQLLQLQIDERLRLVAVSDTVVTGPESEKLRDEGNTKYDHPKQSFDGSLGRTIASS